MPIFSEDDLAGFENALCHNESGAQEIRSAIEKIEIRNAAATVVEDKEMIFKRIEATVTSHGLNTTITHKFRAWIIEQSTALLEKTVASYGEASKEAISTMDRLGWLLAKQGEMEKRLELSQRSLSATQQVYGEEHIQSWWAQKWLALAHFRVNEVDVALALVRPAAQAVENLLGFEDMKTPNALNALGMIEFAADNILEAKAAYAHALEGYSSLNSNDTPPAWLYRLNLAEVAWAEGNLDHALAEARIILAKCEESTAFGHGAKGERTINAAAHVGLVLYTQGDLVQAKVFIQRAISSRQETSSETHPDTLYAQAQFALLMQACKHRAGGKDEKADVTLEATLSNAAKLQVRAVRIMQLARLLNGQSRSHEAQICQEIALAVGVDLPASLTC